MKTLEIVQKTVEGTGADQFDIAMALEEVEQYIKNYCHIPSVPRELRFTHANMAADLIHARFPASGDPVKPHEITSIQVDDVSIHTSPDARSHIIDLDALLLNYREQLNKFRRMRWR